MFVNEMTAETGDPGFKYMIEFPNKVRIYAIDEQSLYNIVEKYCIVINAGSSSNNTKSVSLEKRTFDQLPAISQCPECASPNIVLDNEHANLVCLSCGFKMDAKNHMGNSEKPHLCPPGYKISEDPKSFKIMRKSRTGGGYTTKISKATVEEIYYFMKNKGGQFSACEIDKALNINTQSIYNAMKVLQGHGRVRVELNKGPGRKRLWLFSAI
jgi:hypothetical protein